MQKPSWYHRIAQGLVPIVGIGLTILATSSVGKWATVKRQLRFQQQIESLTTTLQRSLNRYNVQNIN